MVEPSMTVRGRERPKKGSRWAYLAPPVLATDHSGAEVVRKFFDEIGIEHPSTVKAVALRGTSGCAACPRCSSSARMGKSWGGWLGRPNGTHQR